MTPRRHVRVMVHDVWDTVAADWPADTAMVAIKTAALTTTRVTAPPEAFGVKFRGAEVRDEGRSLAELGIPDDAHLIVLRRRRRAAS